MKGLQITFLPCAIYCAAAGEWRWAALLGLLLLLATIAIIAAGGVRIERGRWD